MKYEAATAQKGYSLQSIHLPSNDTHAHTYAHTHSTDLGERGSPPALAGCAARLARSIRSLGA